MWFYLQLNAKRARHGLDSIRAPSAISSPSPRRALLACLPYRSILGRAIQILHAHGTPALMPSSLLASSF